METFRIEEKNGHILFSLGAKQTLLDTGSPVSIASEPFMFQGSRHEPFSRLAGVSTATLSELAGFPIEILLGCDVFENNTLRIRFRDGYVDLGNDIPDPASCVSLKTLRGIPLFPMRLGGDEIRAVLDTGAHLSYIHPKLLEGLDPAGRREDFYPQYGRFTVDTYTLETAVDDVVFEMECGILPDKLGYLLEQTLAMAGASAVVGTRILEEVDCTISWARGTIGWTPVEQREAPVGTHYPK